DKTESNDTELSYTESNNTEINDMNDLNDIESENEISNHSSQFTYNLVDKDYKEILLQEFPEQLTNYLLKYDYRDLEIIKAV
ncbi:TPA: replication protein, partial [Staphylococcus aureus]|nr:replication protein [Staphylococcus aureus]